MTRIEQFFKREQKGILQSVRLLQDSLTRLRYEGKVSRAGNVKAGLRAVNFAGRLMRHHQNCQEKVLFPILEARIPRHEAVIRFLRTDHAEIIRSVRRLKASLKKASIRGRGYLENGKRYELGTYLLCLLKHHVELEKRSVYAAIRKELRRGERLGVEKKLKEWVARYPSEIPA